MFSSILILDVLSVTVAPFSEERGALPTPILCLKIRASSALFAICSVAFDLKNFLRLLVARVPCSLSCQARASLLFAVETYHFLFELTTWNLPNLERSVHSMICRTPAYVTPSLHSVYLFKSYVYH